MTPVQAHIRIVMGAVVVAGLLYLGTFSPSLFLLSLCVLLYYILYKVLTVE